MDKDNLQQKFNSLPEKLQEEVTHFVDFLLSQKKSSKKKSKPTPKFGSGKGMFKMAPDFDAPLEDFKEYMA